MLGGSAEVYTGELIEKVAIKTNFLCFEDTEMAQVRISANQNIMTNLNFKLLDIKVGFKNIFSRQLMSLRLQGSASKTS